MHPFSRIAASRLMLAGVFLCASAAAQTSVRKVQVLGSKDAVEIEVEASDRVVPQTQVLTGPDRLVVDIPNAVPGSGLRSQSVYRGQVKDVRVGLFQSKPPVTRIVLDLKSAQNYQVFPGRTVIIKVMGAAANGSIQPADYSDPASHAGLVTTNYVTRMEPIHAEPAPKPLEVSFRDGLLSIHSNKATLSEVLFAVQQRTGAEIAIAAGAEQEKVVVDLGPASAPEVLAQLLNGSRFNFLILSAPDNPGQLQRVILTPRVEGEYVAPPPQVAQNSDDSDDDTPAPSPHAQSAQSPPIQIAPKPPQPELKGDDGPPEQ